MSQAALHSHPESVFITSCWRATVSHPDHQQDEWVGKNMHDNQGVNKVHHDIDILGEMAADNGFAMTDLFPRRDYTWLKLLRS